eukprot:TRINITY_DN6364_c0_g1_i1.p1 TRINITY_DN6364_c0_g1~~TRINITY_DN6364_c0_g1_i1.p1  ORF type:complete len:620 (-),score=97.49 TRINITY_DN6364_c0_g1_i1:73-1932(-)
MNPDTPPFQYQGPTRNVSKQQSFDRDSKYQQAFPPLGSAAPDHSYYAQPSRSDVTEAQRNTFYSGNAHFVPSHSAPHYGQKQSSYQRGYYNPQHQQQQYFYSKRTGQSHSKSAASLPTQQWKALIPKSSSLDGISANLGPKSPSDVSPKKPQFQNLSHSAENPLDLSPSSSSEGDTASLVGKVKTVRVREIWKEGVSVELMSRQLSRLEEANPRVKEKSGVSNDNSNIPADTSLPASFIPWSCFPLDIQRMNVDDRVEFTTRRLPPGSLFNVFVNAVNPDNDLLLTFALKPTPMLEYGGGGDPRPQKFRYLIVVDLEATCDFSPKPVIDQNNAEIIEFPFVVLDTETLEIVRETQMYVKPELMEGITPYCKVLTGITEEVVEKGISLKEAIKQFTDYMATLPKGSFRIITDGVWDISVQLRAEAARKNIPLQEEFMEYLELKREFRSFLPWFPFTLRDPPLYVILQALKLDFIGKHHSGIDDCLSIVQVVKAMIRQGHLFGEHNVVVTPEYDVDRDQTYQSFSSTAPSNSWKCETCTTKFSSNTSDEMSAVWNKPFSSTCRFCSNPRPASSDETRECQNCGLGFTLTDAEMAYFQSRNYYSPNFCPSCRYRKNSRQVYT